MEQILSAASEFRGNPSHSSPELKSPVAPRRANSNILNSSYNHDGDDQANKFFKSPNGDNYSQKNASAFDPMVSLPQSKLLKLLDALVSTATALRESLPSQITDRELEEGRKTEGKTRSSKVTPRYKNGYCVPDMEILSLEQVLQTEPEHPSILKGEATVAIEMFRQAYPESGLDDPSGSNCARFSHVLAPEQALDFKILQAIFGPRSIGITSNMWALDKYSWEACMRPYLMLFEERLEQQWPLAGRVPLTNGNTSSDYEAILMCNLLVAICCTTIDKARLYERRNYSALTFGKCLKECYRQRVFPPVAADIPSQADMIVQALGLIDIMSKRSTSWSSNLVSQMSPESLMNTSISSILCEGRKMSEDHTQLVQEKPLKSTNPAREDMSQILRDLNIRILTSVGDIKIIWTSTISDHLKLYLAPNNNRLKVYWFGHTAQQLPIYGLYNCDCSEHSNVDEILKELSLTYEFLFGAPHDVAAAKKVRKLYGQTKAPAWLIGRHCSESTSRYFFKKWSTREKTVSDYIDMDNVDPNTDTGLHLGTASLNSFYTSRMNAHLTEEDFYKQFPTFKRRISVLERYMSHQRARTLKDLWRDRRDTLSWYTFWAVLIIGGFGLILTIASLAVSTAQTVAAFQALNPPPRSQT